MPTATITAEYVNPPKGKGPGNIKDSTGRYYKVWRESKVPGTPTLSQFEVGKTYDIEYKDDGEYNGKPQYMITAIKSTSATTSTNGNGANGHDASAAYRNGNGGSTDDSIKWQCMLKVAALIYAGAGADAVDKVIATARFIYHEPIDIVEESKRLFNATEAKE